MSTNDENNNEKKVSENDSIETVNQNITVNNEAEDKVNSEDAVNQDAQPSVDEQTLLEIEAIQAAIEAQEGEEILDEDTETAAGETSDGGSSSAVEFERDGTEIIASTDFQTEGFGFETIEPIQINQDLNAVDADTANAPIVINVDLTEAITEDDVTSGTIIATVSATDEDGGDIIYSLSDDDSAYYIIDNDTGVITLTDEGIALVNSGEDLPSLTVTAESTSGITSTGSQIVEPSATIVTNDPIELTVETTELLTEDTVTTDTVIATASATDEDGGDITYSLSDDDSTYFVIDSDTGVVTLTDDGVALVNSGEDLPAFTVIAESENSSTSTIVDPADTSTVNDPIELTVDTTELLTEDTVTTDTVIATASATDEDGGDITYSLSDDDSTYFIIDSDTGVVTLTDDGVALVNSGEDLPEFTVIAESENSSTSTIVDPADTSTVNDEIELTVETTDLLTEDTVTTDTVIATASATDEDGGDITYSLSDDDSTYFVIDSDTGVVTLTDEGVALVNRGQDLPEFTVIAESENSRTSTIVDPADTSTVNDPIELTAETTELLTEDSVTTDTVIATASATDEDGGDITQLKR